MKNCNTFISGILLNKKMKEPHEHDKGQMPDED